jgi:uncharacterized protein
MSLYISKACTAFQRYRLLISGPLVEVALAVKRTLEADPSSAILVFEDATGRVIDLDLRGSKADIIERLSRRGEAPEGSADAGEPRGRGRPKLGVVSREVTLLPRQWEWLAAQPSGASATLRRLVDEARHDSAPQRKRHAAHEAAYRFMLGIAGDFPGYEEATRALFADDRPRLEQCIGAWPEDIRMHVLRLSGDARQLATPNRAVR